MLLTAKTGVEPYEITALLCAGDVSEVYEARDTHFDCTVAVKMSAVGFTTCFERKARTISSLKTATIAVNRI